MDATILIGGEAVGDARLGRGETKRNRGSGLQATVAPVVCANGTIAHQVRTELERAEADGRTAEAVARVPFGLADTRDLALGIETWPDGAFKRLVAVVGEVRP